METVKPIFRLLRPFQIPFLVIFVFAMIMEGMGVVAPYFFGKIVDAVTDRSLEDALFFVLLSGAIMLLEVFVDQIKNVYELNRFDFVVNKYLDVTGLSKTLSFSLGQHRNEHSGIKQSVLSRGSHSLQSAAYTVSYDVFPTVIGVLFSVAAIFWLQPIVGIITFLGGVVYLAWSFRINIKFHGDVKKLQKMWNENSRLGSEIVRNVGVVKTNAREEKVINEFENDWEGIRNFGKNLWIRFSLFDSFRNVSSIVIRLVAMGITVLLVVYGELEAGMLVTLFFWLSNIFVGLRRLGRTHRRLMELYGAIRKFFVLFHVKPDIESSPGAKKPNIQGEIIFDNVSFVYPRNKFLSDEDDEDLELPQKSRTILKNVSFSVRPGERVALVGESGAGKSTTASLLLRAYDPTKGKILIDGVDLRDIDQAFYLEHVGFVEQDVTLFDNTLRYNILFPLNDRVKKIPKKEIDEIVRLARVDKFLERLPKQYETEIGERGIRLSGGERQRVGIARALMKDPKILIFDEATSNLDTTNEKEIREALRKASEGRTVIIIAHRFSTIKDAEKIIVFHEGKVVGMGTHENLLKSCPKYRSLVQEQVFA